jgi:hypothetical protein
VLLHRQPIDQAGGADAATFVTTDLARSVACVFIARIWRVSIDVPSSAGGTALDVAPGRAQRFVDRRMLMKINITFDCTPEEARSLVGLPDVQPLQKAVMSELQDKVKSGFNAMEPMELVKTMMGQYAGGFEQLQGFLGRIERAVTKKE